MLDFRKVCACGAMALLLAGCDGLDRDWGRAAGSPVPVPLPGPFVLYFDFDSAKVTPVGRKAVAAAAAVIAAAKPASIVIIGHADRAGPEDYNRALSMRRAESTADTLRQAGVTVAMKIVVAGHGETEPQVPTPDGQPEPRNRRVSISLMRAGFHPQEAEMDRAVRSPAPDEPR